MPLFTQVFKSALFKWVPANFILGVNRFQKHEALLCSWRFSRYSAPIHWLDHGHMTSNNETVSRQILWAGNIAKTMTSNGKQFPVTREMLTAFARDQRWPDVVTGISARFAKFAFVLFCYTVEALVSGHPRDAIKMSVTGAGRLREWFS